MKKNHNETTAATLTKVIPEGVLSLLGDPPLVGGEDRALYERLRCQVALAVDPQNIIEWLYVRDVVDLDWEIRRYRHIQSIVLNARVAELIMPQVEWVDTGVAQSLRTHTRDEITTRLKEDHSIDFDAAVARAFTLCRKEIEALERMLASAETRRNAVLREITLHRNMGSFAKRLDDASSKFVASNEQDGTELPQGAADTLIDSDEVGVVP